MKMNKTVLAVAAVVLPLSVGAGSALAYFTANDSAAGGYAVEVGIPETDMKEEFVDGEKRITITNTGDVTIYVRAKAYAVDPSKVTLVPVSVENPRGQWIEGVDEKNEKCYYYNPALKAKEKNEDGTFKYDSTEELRLKIGPFPADPAENDEFDVVVVYEKTSAVKVENGKVVPDWEFALKVEDKVLKEDSNEEGGNNQ